VPLLFVLENNGYAQTTPIAENLAGSITGRFEAFGIPTFEIASQDVVEVSRLAAGTIARVRSEQRPAALVCHTYRFCAHSKGDDFRDPDEIRQHREFDPIAIAGERLSEAERTSVFDAVTAALDEAEREARAG
jgi:TPP-dependent pyruvate/acetoin dehydrogenase alpha subunit